MLDVLICGAGPVGCFFANLMDQLGHSYRLIDRTTFDSRLGQSRALLLTARSLEIMEDRGISDEILSHALATRGARLYTGTKQIAEVEMRGLNTSYPHLTTLPQWKLESILLSRLSVKAERPVKLLSYVQESDHVVAKIQHGDDESNVEEVRARYIIGSDGAHSTVRKGMSDWTFLGTVFNVPFALADVTLTGEKIPDERYFSFIQSKHGALGIIPMFDEDRNKFIARLVLSLGDNAHGTGPADHKDTEDNISYGISTTEPFTMEELQTLIDQRSGIFKFKAEEPLWLTRFGVNERKANGFRRGRAFIMGDAAHCHSPAGGQGMNLGLQDAYNLAWKISAVLKNVAKDPEHLLDSYFFEREPIVDLIINGSGRALRTALNNGIMADFLRSYIMPLASSLPIVQDMVGNALQQLYVSIPSNSPLLAKKSRSSIIEPGKYVPESCILIPKDSMNVSQKTLRRILQKSDRYAVLLIWNHAGGENTSEAFWKMLEPFRKAVRPIIVESANYVGRYRIPDYAANNSDGSNGFWCDPKSQLAQLFSIQERQAGIIVVRPDMYVAFSESYNTDSEVPLGPLKNFLSLHLNTE